MNFLYASHLIAFVLGLYVAFKIHSLKAWIHEATAPKNHRRSNNRRRPQSQTRSRTRK